MATSATLTILQQGENHTFQWQQTDAGALPVMLFVTQRSPQALQQRIDHAVALLNDLLVQRNRSGTQPATGAVDPDPLSALGRLLFNQLFPPALQAAIQELPPESQLTLLTNVDSLPWEIAHDGHDFLALTHAVSRYYLSDTFPRRPQPKRDLRWSALLIGNPTADLPHTAAEIEHVAQFIESMAGAAPPRILMQRRATKATVLQELASGQYDLIHYAGHAHFAVDEEAACGLLLARGELLTAQEIQQNLAGRPFVFLNGCESARNAPPATAAPTLPGALDTTAQGSAQGLATAFLLGGARGLVGTHWPIYDPSSQRFATAFYRALLQGIPLDRAVQQARVQLQHEHPTDPLWAAFTLYATPGESLVLTPQRIARPGTALVVGLTRLFARYAEAHGEAVSRQIDLLHEQIAPVIQRFGGSIVPTAQAHVLALFPPTSAQNDAERAVRAAQVLRAMADDAGTELRFDGLGLSSGELHWTADATAAGSVQAALNEGAPRPQQAMPLRPIALGLPIQRAMALAQLAGVGEIYVDHTVYTLVHTRFTFAPTSAPLAGEQEEQDGQSFLVNRPYYHLLPTVAHTRALSGTPATRLPFVGRTRELALLQELWQRCRGTSSHGQGQLVGIVGEAGIGKSRLVQTFAEQMANQSVQWLQAACPATYQAGPYEVVTQLLRHLLHLEAEAVTTAMLTERLRKVVPEAQSAELVALLAPLFDVLEPEIPRFHWDLQAQQRRLVNLLGSLLARQARQTPLILLLDDLHWADESSLEILAQLAAGIERLPLLLIALFRSEQVWQPPWWHRRNYHQIHLDALDPAAGRTLLCTLLDTAVLPSTLQDTLLARSNGNPLFVQELVAALAETGALVRSANGWQLQQAAAPEQMPGTIQRVLLSRLDALPPSTRRVLDAASVVGDPIDPALLRSATQPNIEPPALDAAIADLEHRNFLYQTWDDQWSAPAWLERWTDDEPFNAVSSAATLHFHHALVREVAYSGMRIADRQRMHRRLGEALAQTEEQARGERGDLERLVHHFYHSVVMPAADGSLSLDPQAEPELVQRTIDYLQQAGARAQAKYAGRSAIRHYRHACALVEALPGAQRELATLSVALLDGLGAAHQLVSELDEAIAALEAAHRYQQAIDPPVSNAACAALVRRIGRLYEWKSDYPTALIWMEQGLALVTPPAAPAERAVAAALHVRIGCVRYSQGDHEAAAAQCEAGLALADTPDADPVRAEAHNLLGSIHDLQGATDEADRHYQESLAIYRELNNPYEVARVENNLGLVAFRSGDWGAAKTHLQRGIDFWEEIEDQYNLAFNRLNLGVIEMYQGQWTAAEQNFRTALALWGEANNQRWCALCHTNLGLLSIEQARWAEARHHLQESRALLTQQAIRHFLPEVTYALAEVALGEGDAETALTQAEEAVDLARSLDMKLEEGIALRTMGKAHGALGDWGAADACLQQSLRLLRSLQNRYEVARTLLVLADTPAETDPAADPSDYRAEAAHIFQELGVMR